MDPVNGQISNASAGKQPEVTNPALSATAAAPPSQPPQPPPKEPVLPPKPAGVPEEKKAADETNIKIDSEAHSKILTQQELTQEINACIERIKEEKVNKDTSIDNCILQLLKAKKITYLKKREFDFKYLGHLTSTEGFVKEGERVGLSTNANEQLIVDNSKVTSMALWNQKDYLLLHLYFLIELYMEVEAGRKELPEGEFSNTFTLELLLRELQITTNALRFKIAYDIILESEDEKVKTTNLTAMIGDFLQSLDNQWKNFEDGDVAVLPIGSSGHALYLIIVKNSPIEGENRKECFAQIRIDNFLSKNSDYHKYSEGQPPKAYPRLITSIPVSQENGLASCLGKERPDLNTYLVEICKAKKGNQTAADPKIYLDQKKAKELNFNLLPIKEILKYADYYFPMPVQTTATCVVHNFKSGIQYRLRTAAFYNWFNQAEIAKVFEEKQLPNQMTESEKRLLQQKSHKERFYRTSFKMKHQLEKNYLQNKFIKPLLPDDELHEKPLISTNFLRIKLIYSKPAEDKDTEKAKSKEIFVELDDLFKHPQTKAPVEKVQITGETGTGKSLLCQYLSLAWATNTEEMKESNTVFVKVSKYLKEKFEVVIWIKVSEIDEADVNLYQFILDNQFLQSTVGDKPSAQELETYVDQHKNTILFIIDGENEFENLSPQQKRILDEIYAKAFFILLISKPFTEIKYNSEKYKFDSQLSNVGFWEESVEAFVKNKLAKHKPNEQIDDPSLLYQQDVTQIMRYLKASPGVWSLAQNPLNLELICRLAQKNYLNMKSSSISTAVFYQLFVDRISNITRGSAIRYTVEDILNVTISPTPTVQDLLKPFLEELAIENTRANNIIASPELIKQTLVNVLAQVGFGGPHLVKYHDMILTAASNPLSCLRKVNSKQYDLSNVDSTYCFTNLSFQNFFAASFIRNKIISEDPKDKNLAFELIQKNKYLPHFENVWALTASLLFQHGKIKKDNFADLVSFWTLGINTGEADLFGVYHMALVLACLEECGDSSFDLPIHREMLQKIFKWFQWCTQNCEAYPNPHLEFFGENSTAIQFHPKLIDEIETAYRRGNNLSQLNSFLMTFIVEPPVELITRIVTIIKAKATTADIRSQAIYGLLLFNKLPNSSLRDLNELLKDPSLEPDNRDYLQRAITKTELAYHPLKASLEEKASEKVQINSASVGIEVLAQDEVDKVFTQAEVDDFLAKEPISNEEQQKTVNALSKTNFYLSIVIKLLNEIDLSNLSKSVRQVNLFLLFSKQRVLIDPPTSVLNTLFKIKYGDIQPTVDLRDAVVSFINNIRKDQSNAKRINEDLLKLIDAQRPGKHLFFCKLLFETPTDCSLTPEILEVAFKLIDELPDFHWYTATAIRYFTQYKADGKYKKEIQQIVNKLFNILIQTKNKYTVDIVALPLYEMYFSELDNLRKEELYKRMLKNIIDLSMEPTPVISNFQASIIANCNKSISHVEILFEIFCKEKSLRNIVAKIFSKLESIEAFKILFSQISSLYRNKEEDSELFFKFYFASPNFISICDSTNEIFFTMNSKNKFYQLPISETDSDSLKKLLAKTRKEMKVDEFYEVKSEPVARIPNQHSRTYSPNFLSSPIAAASTSSSDSTKSPVLTTLS